MYKQKQIQHYENQNFGLIFEWTFFWAETFEYSNFLISFNCSEFGDINVICFYFCSSEIIGIRLG
jgi:hypothetical protein